MILTTLLGLLGCAKDTDKTNPIKTITSVEAVTLTLRGMRGGTVYKFATQTNSPKLCRYREIYSGKEDFLKLEQCTTCSTEVMIELMNTCGISRWNGFHGAHPKNVSDGIMFTLSATVNGGQTIHADGSANYPKGYHEFVRTLNLMLAENIDD